MMLRLAVLALLAAAVVVLPGCGVERICGSGEVAVETEEGGRWCEDPEPGDPTCPDGEILLKNPDAGREGCIPNVYSPDPYTDQLTR
jgi:hypothetical protein